LGDCTKVTSQKERKKRAARLTQCAIRKYGELRNRKPRPPISQLVLSMFYHVTSVRRATRALRELKRSFVDWNEVRVSHPAEVAAVLSSARWALEGAERVVWLLRELYQVYNRTNLDFLAELTPTQARSCLTRLQMVQRAVADEVLLLSLGVPVLPCSAAAARMCHRLGLLANDRPMVKNQRVLAGMFDEQYYPSILLFFCDYAEKLCLPDEPLCNRCPLEKTCQGAK
jgi:endonuclease III